MRRAAATYSSQSTATIRVTSLAGNPTAVKTITMVTSPAFGTPAAPILATVAVILKQEIILCPSGVSNGNRRRPLVSCVKKINLHTHTGRT